MDERHSQYKADMKVSVIIPIYNVSDYIEECLNSVIRQTYTDIEVLIVDDCGTDNSMNIVKKFISDYQGPILFKILHHSNNRGLSAARNTGLEAAQGEFVYFLDSDDYIYKDCIRILVETITQEEGIECAMGNFERNIPIQPHIKVYSGIYANGLSLFSKRDIYVMAWNHLYRTNFLRSHFLKFKEGVVHEDILWSFSVYCHTRKIAVVDQVTYFYRYRNDSICSKPQAERYKDICLICKSIIEYALNPSLKKDENIFSCTNNQLKRYYLQAIYLQRPDLVSMFYETVRNTSYWSLWQIWMISHDMRRLIFHLHRLLPPQKGFKFFQYVFAKYFDN